MFYFTTNGKTVKTNSMPYNTYALSGVSDEKDKGLLYVRVLEGLVPLTNINGGHYNFKEMAGKTFNGINWIDDIPVTDDFTINITTEG